MKNMKTSKSKIAQLRVLIKRGKTIAITSKFRTAQQNYTIVANSKSKHRAMPHIDGTSNFIHIY